MERKTNKQILDEWDREGWLNGFSGYSKLRLAMLLESITKSQTGHYGCLTITKETYRIVSQFSNPMSEFLTSDYIVNYLNNDTTPIKTEYIYLVLVAKRIATLFIESFKDKIILDKFDIDGNYIVIIEL